MQALTGMGYTRAQALHVCPPSLSKHMPLELKLMQSAPALLLPHVCHAMARQAHSVDLTCLTAPALAPCVQGLAGGRDIPEAIDYIGTHCAEAEAEAAEPAAGKPPHARPPLAGLQRHQGTARAGSSGQLLGSQGKGVLVCSHCLSLVHACARSQLTHCSQLLLSSWFGCQEGS